MARNTTKTYKSNKQKALAYARAGIPVFPCNYNNKAPLCKNGFKAATTDAQQIHKWWNRYPSAYIGAPNTSFTVIDFDLYKLKGQAKIIMDEVVSSISGTSALPPCNFIVETKRGGKHYYYKRDEKAERYIDRVPSIDILGSGGYCILPDQQDYVCLTSKDPWAAIERLNPIDINDFYEMAMEYQPIFEEVKRILKELQGKRGKPSMKHPEFLNDPETKEILARRPRRSKTELRKEVFNKDNAYRQAEDRDSFRFDKDGNLIVDIGSGLYDRVRYTDKKDYYVVENDFSKEDLIQVKEGELDGKIVTAIFHNESAQKKIANYMGIRVPDKDKPIRIRSVLPNHVDRRPSMGVRWSDDGSHLILRDFSNFAKDSNGQLDYNLTRIFVSQKAGTVIGRLSPTEFIVWTTRMLDESAILCVDSLKRNYEKSIGCLGPEAKKVAESLIYLDAIKRTYDGYSETTVFTKSFGAVWSGVKYGSMSNIMNALEKHGFVEVVGMHDVKDRWGNFTGRKTKLYALNTVEKRNNQIENTYNRANGVYNPLTCDFIDLKFDGLEDVRTKKDFFMRRFEEYVNPIENASETEETVSKDIAGRMHWNLFKGAKRSAVGSDTIDKVKILTEFTRETCKSMYESADGFSLRAAFKKINDMKFLAKEGILQVKKSNKPKTSKSAKRALSSFIVSKSGMEPQVNPVIEKSIPVLSSVTPAHLKEIDFSKNKQEQTDGSKPNLCTYIGATMNERSYRRVVSFLKDIKADHIPDWEDMTVPVLVSTKYMDVQADYNYHCMLEDIQLEIIEGSEGNKMLVAYAFSETLYDIIHELNQEYDNEIEPGIVSFVISGDIGDRKYDMDKITMRLNSYVDGIIHATPGPVEYYTDEGIVRKMEGFNPESDDD